MPSSQTRGCSLYRQPSILRDIPDEETINWRAVCGNTARTVRREGSQKLPYPYLTSPYGEVCFASPTLFQECPIAFLHQKARQPQAAMSPSVYQVIKKVFNTRTAGRHIPDGSATLARSRIEICVPVPRQSNVSLRRRPVIIASCSELDQASSQCVSTLSWPDLIRPSKHSSQTSGYVVGYAGQSPDQSPGTRMTAWTRFDNMRTIP